MTRYPPNIPIALPRPRDSRDPDLRRASRCLARAFECIHRGEVIEAKRAVFDAHEAIGALIAREVTERRQEEWSQEVARLDSERSLIESFCPMAEK